jgi:hypothetical protein
LAESPKDKTPKKDFPFGVCFRNILKEGPTMKKQERTPEDFLAACGRKKITLKLDFWNRLQLYGDASVVSQAQALLREQRELEAGILLRLAKSNPALMDALEKRAGILESDGLPSAPLHAALAHMGRN